MNYYIDLFSGCGGLSLGLMNAGWRGLFAIEKNKDAFSTLQHNLINNKKHFDWPAWLPVENYDINYFIKNYYSNIKSLEGRIQLIAGGPPCQGFSTAGARDEKDKRNSLVHSYIKFISIVKPNLIFFENVKGFTFEFKIKNGKGKTYSDEVKEGLIKLGYELEDEIVNFSEYGIPQARSRFILVGRLGNKFDDFFNNLRIIKNIMLEEKGINKKISLSDAISDLLEANGKTGCPDSKYFNSGKYADAKTNYQQLLRNGISIDESVPDSHRFANHKDKSVKQFELILAYGERNKRITQELKNKFDVKKRSITPLAKNLPCPVLTSHPDDYIHYCEPRILTVREYARIQSFPDWYQFKGKYTTGGKVRKYEVPRYSQLGNAIPPLFAEQIGLTLIKY
jgi:DNA (cytosine-5)-methyltransferase 1